MEGLPGVRLSSPCVDVSVNIGLNWSEIALMSIQITDRAAAHIRKMLATRNQRETGLRVGIKAGGCSGFEYTFGWEAAPRLGDSIFEGTDHARLFVDARSLRLLDGSVLDYDTSLLSKGFVITNPHATSTCGCGTSFSVDGSTFNQTVASREKS
jgi:iron-sulfur cluster assembly accessory protein